MTTKQETALAVKSRVENRVAMSGALLERMGYTVEQYERVCLNALLVSPGLAECTPQSMDIAITHCITAGLIPDGKAGGNHTLREERGNAGADGGRVSCNASAPGDPSGLGYPHAGSISAQDDWEYRGRVASSI